MIIDSNIRIIIITITITITIIIIIVTIVRVRIAIIITIMIIIIIIIIIIVKIITIITITVGIVCVCVSKSRLYNELTTIVKRGTCVRIQVQIPDHPEILTHRGVSEFFRLLTPSCAQMQCEFASAQDIPPSERKEQMI